MPRASLTRGMLEREGELRHRNTGKRTGRCINRLLPNYLLSEPGSLSHSTSSVHQSACPTLPPQYIGQPVPHYLLSVSTSLSHTTSSVHQPACPTLPPQHLSQPVPHYLLSASASLSQKRLRSDSVCGNSM
ncbi:hypothetical protein BaRGS_00038649 [Batillaria attramentaria]|uniref:Uncharacterized protein n=1 Tax=Batillaria attramentaria TaxID=370345 RepID=A0ABD0J5N6_9CAEN